MKIYTMTWYTGNNYGSVLQAYALPYAIKRLGYPCEILAYHPPFVQKLHNMLINRNLAAHIQYKLNAFKMRKQTSDNRAVDSNLALFDAFRQRHMHITPVVHTAKDIRALTGKDAVFVCGSDQIWNPHFYDPYYFLHFVKNPVRKIPYAPSFGVKEMPSYQRGRIGKCLRSFNAFSVREPRGGDFIKELTGREAFVACDPTALLTKEEWTELATPVKTPENPYVFCYFLSYNAHYMETARRAAESLGMELKVLPMRSEDMDLEETIKEPVGPTEWLTWLSNASLVLTDSFHCALFSIRFGKDFYIFQRFAANNKRGQNSRIENLLSRTGLEDRMIAWETSPEAFLTIAPERRAYAADALTQHAETSLAWLQAQLALAEGDAAREGET